MENLNPPIITSTCECCQSVEELSLAYCHDCTLIIDTYQGRLADLASMLSAELQAAITWTTDEHMPVMAFPNGLEVTAGRNESFNIYCANPLTADTFKTIEDCATYLHIYSTHLIG